LSLLAFVARRLGRNSTGFGDKPKLDGLVRVAAIRRIGRTELQKATFREGLWARRDLMITWYFMRAICTADVEGYGYSALPLE
jgi:hypothetical protein